MNRCKFGVSLLIPASLLVGSSRILFAADVHAPKPQNRMEIETILAKAD